MPLNLASPGIVVREVDLTVGRVDPTSASIGAIVSPFAQGPVDVPTLVENEKDLLETFGKPYSTDKHYEHWLTASSYLAYGGNLSVVRADDSGLVNGYVGTGTSAKVKSVDHYEELGYDENRITNVTVIARNPGSWGNGLRVGILDSRADQTITVGSTAGMAVGFGVTQAVPAGTVLAGAGSTSLLDGHFKGIITGIAGTTVDVKLLEHVPTSGPAVEVDYQPSGVYQFSTTGALAVMNNSGSNAANTTVSATLDWFDQQTLNLTGTTTVKWNTLADRPGTSEYAAARNSRFDEVHVVVIDGDGAITGNSGTILEKHLSLSKAKDAEFSLGSPSHWRKFTQINSQYIFAGGEPVGVVTTGFSSAFTLESDVGWDQNAQDITFAAIGNLNSTLTRGKNYGGQADTTTTGALTSGLDDLVSGYSLFENTEKVEVDFILMGSAGYAKEQAQALANKCVAVAEARKDAVAFISPYRGAAITDATSQTAVQVRSDDDITDNVLSFYAPITSSSYAVFDSGYKYMFDRFANTFRYVPLNGDMAGLCARNDANQFPWFSPAGTARGAILNAVKLAYTPSKVQRDRLYSNRVNPVIFSPGAGIILFGDKTGFGKASAFDRINVRRLFIYLEDAISAAAKDQLFEFNDEITRTNFVNIIEPFLRDVQAKRGIFDYVVVCDETNNTAAIIDNNEFVADIYIKPARSINFIGLTFVATRTGVSFDEVIGNV
tara:strand:+ start:585 stop:2744 length:2160 start_codon:yes stop_codon:yes gene_type:complete